MFNNNHFKIAYRSLWRKRAFSFLNIAGLAVGIAASLLIFLVIRNEMSYDSYHTNANRIYRVVTTVTNVSNGEVESRHAAAPVPLSSTLRQDFPGIEQAAALWDIGTAQVYVPGKDLADEKRFNVKNGLFFSEPHLFKIFDYTWLVGNAEGLKDLNTVVIDKSLAEAFFGSYSNAIGKTVQLWSYRVPLKIVGVYKDLPANTDVPVRLVGSFVTFLKLNGSNLLDKSSWGHTNSNSSCFVLASAKQDMNKLQQQMPGFVNHYYPQEQGPKAKQIHLAFQPLKEMHLDKRFTHYGKASLTYRELYSLGLIGIFLLLVACINFINLATAQSVSRAKEIGVRKVLGSTRTQLLRQFLNETALITGVAVVLACVIVTVSLPALSTLMQKEISPQLLYSPATILYLLITGVLITLLAGSYPAMVLSGFNPVAAIKSKITARTIGGISLRRGLVVMQFVIAQLLVIGTLVVVKQMAYFRSQPMGFTKEAVILISLPSENSYKTHYENLKQQLSQIPGVSAASLCMDAPSAGWESTSTFFFDSNPEKQPFVTMQQFADTGYLRTFQLSLAAGRMPYASDTIRELLVNETMVKRLGLKSVNEILDKTIAFDDGIKHPVVGVLQDFNSRNLRFAVEPLVLTTYFGTYSFIALRLDPAKMHTTLPQVQKVFTSVFPTYLYDCTFLDERIGQYYEIEGITAKLFEVFAFLAIFISCLGLYGLISFMAVQKTKEVGIRKVLGASVQSIVYMFSREFTILIGIAFLIAAPLGYYFMQEWLAGFYYHTNMGWGIFVMSVVLSVIIAWMTVGYKAISAALANPVKSLKTE
ncbi:duplicated orphan permease [Chitinophaga sp. YR573]|uniref:FtsX-like permease family protein n=1 Tax=Chitinophaga sp. YR573 TaxID=1881040 RepID=UPI0008AEB6CC|nr:FtsX-like permease family protein [Chitinophaga sp. YR573]SEW15918.1 duplicated orphan permease [Chitinophaga sp. YR573]